MGGPLHEWALRWQKGVNERVTDWQYNVNSHLPQFTSTCLQKGQQGVSVYNNTMRPVMILITATRVQSSTSHQPPTICLQLEWLAHCACQLIYFTNIGTKQVMYRNMQLLRSTSGKWSRNQTHMVIKSKLTPVHVLISISRVGIFSSFSDFSWGLGKGQIEKWWVDPDFPGV